MAECLAGIWLYLKSHDAPNWIAIFISLFVWPPILWGITYWLVTRRRQNVSDFLVTFTPSKIAIGDSDYDAITLTFINQTGSIVYLSHARLREVKKRFEVPVAASRDMARGQRELVFAIPPSTKFDQYECILQTDVTHGRVLASIAIKNPMDDAFYSYRPCVLRRWFWAPKYFLLEYVIMVGQKKIFCRDGILKVKIG